MSFSLFEASVGSDAEVRLAKQASVDKMAAAIYDCREQLGPSLFASATMEEFRHKIAMMKSDQSLYKIVGQHLDPVAGVMRQIAGKKGALEKEFQAILVTGTRIASDDDDDSDSDDGFGGKKAPPFGKKDSRRRHAEDDGPTVGPMEEPSTLTKGQQEGVRNSDPTKIQDSVKTNTGDGSGATGKPVPGRPSNSHSGGLEDAKDLKPKGDFAAYLKKVDQNSAKVDRNFTSSAEHTAAQLYFDWAESQRLPALKKATLARYANGNRSLFEHVARGIQAWDFSHNPKAPTGQSKTKLKDVTAGNYEEDYADDMGGSHGNQSRPGHHDSYEDYGFSEHPGYDEPSGPPVDHFKNDRKHWQNDPKTHSYANRQSNWVGPDQSSSAPRPQGRDAADWGNWEEHLKSHGVDPRNHEHPAVQDAIRSHGYAMEDGEAEDELHRRHQQSGGEGNPDPRDFHQMGSRQASGFGQAWADSERRRHNDDENYAADQRRQKWMDEQGAGDVASGHGFGEGASVKQDPMKHYVGWCKKNGYKRLSARNVEIYSRGNPQLCVHLAQRMQAAIHTARVRQAGPRWDRFNDHMNKSYGYDVNDPTRHNFVDERGSHHREVSDDFDDSGFSHEGRQRRALGEQHSTMSNPHPDEYYEQHHLVNPNKMWNNFHELDVHHQSSRRSGATDYLTKANDALTQLLNQKAEEFQETIAPLQQALVTVQQATQLQQAQSPMNVLPPPGTVNVMPGGDQGPVGMPAPGAQDLGAAAQALAGGGAPPPGQAGAGGAPAGGMSDAQGGPPPAAAGGGLPPELDPSAQQATASRRRRSAMPPDYDSGNGHYRPDENDPYQDEHHHDDYYAETGDMFYGPGKSGPKWSKDFVDPHGHVPTTYSDHPEREAKRGGRGKGRGAKAPFRQADGDGLAGGDPWAAGPASEREHLNMGPQPQEMNPLPGMGPMGRARGGPGDDTAAAGESVDGAFNALMPTGTGIGQKQGATVHDLWNQWSQKNTGIGGDADYDNFAQTYKVGPQAMNKLKNTHQQQGTGPVMMGAYDNNIAEEASKSQHQQMDAHMGQLGYKFDKGLNQWTKPGQKGVKNFWPHTSSTQHEAWTGWGPAQFPVIRKVAGWDWDSYQNGYLANGPRTFECFCGEPFPAPSGFHRCACGEQWNSYVIGSGGNNHEASAEKFLVRQVPTRPNVIMANRQMEAEVQLMDREGNIHTLVDPGEVDPNGGSDAGHSTFKKQPNDWARRGDGAKWQKSPIGS